MDSKAIDSAVKATDITRILKNETQTGDRENKTEEYGGKEIELKRNYDAVSKNGDTLEISEDGKKLSEHPCKGSLSPQTKKVFSDSEKKISDNILTEYSEAKLKQLYINKEISKQQYERIIKKRKLHLHLP